MELQRKLHCRCSTGSSIPTPLKLSIKTPEQYHSCCSCALRVDFEQILYIGFHAYLAYFHCFEQVNAIWEGFQKLKNIDDLIHFSNVQLGKVLV